MTNTTEYKTIRDMTEPGYYWWLPEWKKDEPEKKENWSVVSWHPYNTKREKCGTFLGPLTPPTNIPT